MYSNLPFKYALWTRVVGAHLVGRCVLYSYRFLDILIRWIVTGNGWNLRRPAWPKPSYVKSLQSWASWTCRASGRWGGSMKWVKAPSGKSGTIGRTYCNGSFVARAYRTFVEFDSDTGFKGFEALHNIVLDIDDQLICSNVQTEARQLYDEMRWSFEMF